MSDQLAQLIQFMPPYKVEGYTPDMVYDRPRNQYYFNALKKCKDKVCAEPGFGTGILTISAIYQGAKHVYAYEKDYESFLLGKQIINRLGMADKVTFIHSEFYPMPEHEIVFHELIDRAIWGGDLKKVREMTKAHMIPETVSCNIRYTKGKDILHHINEDYVNDRRIMPFTTEKDKAMNNGLPFNTLFNRAMIYVVSSNNYRSYDSIKKEYLMAENSHILNSYTVDMNAGSVPDKVELDINVPEDDVVVWCENFIDDFRLMDGHWRADKVVHKYKAGNAKFILSTVNKNWWIEE